MIFDRVFSAFRGRRDQRSEMIVRETYELKVHLACDDETGRWYVAESDIPGLRLEDENPLKLIERIEQAAPELIELNLDEVVEACRASKPNLAEARADIERKQPTWRPVFDSPLKFAYA